MELRQFRYFVRIVEEGSVSRASQSLHIAQPALSQQMARLEDELGVRLLTRSVRGVTPTDAGSAVYQHALRLLKQVEAVRAVAAEADKGPSGPVSIGLPWTVRSIVGLPLVQQVRERFSAVRLEIVEGGSAALTSMLAMGKLDLAVVFGGRPEPGLSMKPLIEEPLALVGARGTLKGRPSATLDQLTAMPLLLLSRPNGIREQLEALWAQRGRSPHIVAEINAPELLVQAVGAGLGFSILPSCGIEEAVRRGELEFCALKGAEFTRTIYIARSRLFPPRKAAEAVQETLEALAVTAVREGRWRAKVLPKEAARPSRRFRASK